jgi:hypothetical protein
MTAVRAQDGLVSKPVRFAQSLDAYLRDYVEPRLATWMQEDRQKETRAQFRERVSEENRKLKIAQWEQEALDIYRKKYKDVAGEELAAGKPDMVYEMKAPDAAGVDGLPDVDADIPQTDIMNGDVYAVIIGNEDYAYESPTRFSARDAGIFYEYCWKTLGIPSQNITVKENATYGDMLRSIQFLADASRAKSGNIRILFYYSGHGMADLKDNSMYLIPVDGSSLLPQAALKAEYLYKALSDMKSLSATVFLDACFSGKSSEGALAALVDGAGIEITPREESLYGNLVVFSATSASEIAYPYEEMQHRMFTYFLLKRLQETKGDATYADLAEYVISHVKSHAFDINRKMQTPKVQTSYDITETWKEWKFVR